MNDGSCINKKGGGGTTTKHREGENKQDQKSERQR